MRPRVVDSERLREFIHDRNVRGKDDGEVAAEWGGVSRGYVSKVRRKMGIPAIRKCNSPFAGTSGEQSLNARRLKAFREFGVRMGWPGVERPRQVQILNLLYEQGPKTRAEIYARLGLRYTKSVNYLSHLLRTGLVIRLPKTGGVFRYAIRSDIRRQA